MLTHVGTQTMETSRLVLRRVALDDAEMVFKNWACDEEVSRYMRWSAHQSVDETRAFVAQWVEAYQSEGQYLWGICLKDGGMIGTVGVLGIDEHDSRAEVAYCIGKPYWGNGYTAEAVAAALGYMFSRVGIQRIEAYHSVNNPASGAVMKKAGMLFEGHARRKYRSRDGFQDCDLYGITREDWEIRREIARINSLPVTFDGFFELPELSDGVIHLVCTEKKPAIPEKNYVPAYVFAVCKGSEKIGEVNLRIGYVDGLYYGGQIGYGIDEGHRGNGYAVRACRLLIPVVKAHGMGKLFITNDIANDASRRVCEKLGARLVRVARLPEWHDLYAEGHRFVNIFEWEPDA